MSIISAPARFVLNEMNGDFGDEEKLTPLFPRDGIQALKSAEIWESSSFMEKLVMLIMTLSVANSPFYLIFCNNENRKTNPMRINVV